MKTCILSLVLLLLSASLATAQVRSGTLIVFYFSKDQIGVAADSRGSFIGADRAPDDTQCKVAAINGQVVFASVGANEFNPSDPLDLVHRWDNIEEARRSYKATNSNSAGRPTLRTVADAWGATMASNWRSLYFLNRSLVQQTAERLSGYLTRALWGGFDTDNNVTLFLTDIVLDENSIEPVAYRTSRINSCQSEFCTMGRGEIAVELLLGVSDRAKAEIANWKPSPSYDPKYQELLKAVRLVDLTIAFGENMGVGGSIDAVQLSSNGSVYWLARKKNCPAD